jgi:hypothetical protein
MNSPTPNNEADEELNINNFKEFLNVFGDNPQKALGLGRPKEQVKNDSTATTLGVIGGDPLLQGLTAGWSDEFISQAAKLFGLDKEEIRQASKEAINRNKENYPLSTMAGEIIGSVPTALMSGGATNAAMKGLGVLGTAGKAATATRIGIGAGAGAIEGGLYGAGASNKEGLDRIGDAGRGAVIGGALGGLGQGVGEGFRAGARKRLNDPISVSVKEIDNATTPASTQQANDDMIREWSQMSGNVAEETSSYIPPPPPRTSPNQVVATAADTTQTFTPDDLRNYFDISAAGKKQDDKFYNSLMRYLGDKAPELKGGDLTPEAVGFALGGPVTAGMVAASKKAINVVNKMNPMVTAELFSHVPTARPMITNIATRGLVDAENSNDYYQSILDEALANPPQPVESTGGFTPNSRWKPNMPNIPIPDFKPTPAPQVAIPQFEDDFFERVNKINARKAKEKAKQTN